MMNLQEDTEAIDREDIPQACSPCQSGGGSAQLFWVMEPRGKETGDFAESAGIRLANERLFTGIHPDEPPAFPWQGKGT
jgi:hypothetical protein